MLAGLIGALGAFAATALGRPTAVRAADGDTILMGSENHCTNTTEVIASTGIGLFGIGPEVGVRGSSSGVGVLGTASPGTAVVGVSGLSGVSIPDYTGVYGASTAGSGGRGVWGFSSNGRGVFGQSSSGQGVRGYSATGSAGYFSTSATDKGAAIRAIGRVRLDNCAGVATIVSGTNSIPVTPGIVLTSSSAVTATLLGDAGGSTTVKRVAVNTSTGVFTIVLTNPASANVKVAWHVFG
jgi:hypothetical protein